MENKKPVISKKLFILAGIFASILVAWIIFNIILTVSISADFDKCEKKVNTQTVPVEVIKDVETRTKTTGSKKHKHKTRYSVAVYTCTYNNASDRYETRDLSVNYAGTTEAVYLNGVVWWHDKELSFEKLSVMKFPDFDEKDAYNPKDVGISAIRHEIMGNEIVWNVIVIFTTFDIIPCLVLGFVIRRKGF